MVKLVLVVASLPGLASAHSRWSCPEPRSPYTDITRGPCGDDTDNFDDSFLAKSGDGSILEISPGLLRVTFEEALSHVGAPFRISLSGKLFLFAFRFHNVCQEILSYIVRTL